MKTKPEIENMVAEVEARLVRLKKTRETGLASEIMANSKSEYDAEEKLKTLNWTEWKLK